MCEDEKIIGLVGAPILGVARHPARENSRGSARRAASSAPMAPGNRASGAQARPGLVIAALRRAQIDPIAAKPERVGPGEKQARKGFALRRHRDSRGAVKRPAAPAIDRNLRAGSTDRARPGSAAPTRQRATTRRIAASSTASMRRTISAGSNGVPWISKMLRQLFAARGRALERHQQTRLHLRFGAIAARSG